MIRTVGTNPIPKKASDFMAEFLKHCDSNGNLIVMGRVGGSQTKGLSSEKSDIDLSIGFVERLPNLLSLRPRGLGLGKLPFRPMEKRDLHGEVVKDHLGFIYEDTEFELTVNPLFTKGHLVYPNTCDTCPENINIWTEARTGNELVPQLFFQNGKALYDLFTAHEVYERPEWIALKRLCRDKLHISAGALAGFFSGYMSSQLKAHENILSFKNFLNVNNLTSSKIWQYMSDEDKKEFHSSVLKVQKAFTKFKQENPVLKGRRWIDFEKREAKALEENRIDPVVKQVLEGTYIGMCGLHFFQTGEFHCNYEALLEKLEHVFRKGHLELLRKCLLHKTGKEKLTVPVENFIRDIREPRLDIFNSIKEALDAAYGKQEILPDKLTPAMVEENSILLQEYLLKATPMDYGSPKPL